MEKKPPFVITDEMIANAVFAKPHEVDPKKYPVNAAEFLASDIANNDKGFLLAAVSPKADGNGDDLTVTGDMPFAINSEELRWQIFLNRGILLPSRQDVMKNTFHPKTVEAFPNHDLNTLNTIAIAMAVVDADGQVAVTDNSVGKPGSAANTNFVIAGLVTSGFFEAVADETIEELSAVQDMGDYVLAYYMTPPAEFPGDAERNRQHHEELQGTKETNMRHQLELLESPMADKPFVWVELPSKTAQLPGMKPVTIDILGEKTETQAATTLDTKKHSYNLVFGATADINENMHLLVCEYFKGDDWNEKRSSRMVSFEDLARTYLEHPQADPANGIPAALPALKNLTVAILGPDRANELMLEGRKNAPAATAVAPAPNSNPRLN